MATTGDSAGSGVAGAGSGAHGPGIFLGSGRLGPVFAGPEQCVLVLGPPRSGKTSAVVVPNLFAARGGVLAASTKPDVLAHSLAHRRRLGRCALFDPSGTCPVPPGVDAVGWSPLSACADWDGAVLMADAMVGAASPRWRSAEASHWAERSAALLAPLLHSAALDHSPLARVVAEVQRREPDRALGVLARAGGELALDTLSGIVATDAREQSGIWSSAAGALAAYRSSAALEAAERPAMRPDELLEGHATLYVVAPSEHQRLVAPVVAGLVRELRSTAYAAHGRGADRPPVLLVLDELANIAPLHDLPSLVAEGASQGVVTLACLQDLSQARDRWGASAEGFFSIFGAKLVLGGIGDPDTLRQISLLAGETRRHVVSRPAGLSAVFARGARRTRTSERVPRLPPDAVASPPPGSAILVRAATVERIGLTPFFSHPAWRELATGGRAPLPGTGRARPAPTTRRRDVARGFGRSY